jgi:hypothetical protein
MLAIGERRFVAFLPLIVHSAKTSERRGKLSTVDEMS